MSPLFQNTGEKGTLTLISENQPLRSCPTFLLLQKMTNFK